MTPRPPSKSEHRQVTTREISACNPPLDSFPHILRFPTLSQEELRVGCERFFQPAPTFRSWRGRWGSSAENRERRTPLLQAESSAVARGLRPRRPLQYLQRRQPIELVVL